MAVGDIYEVVQKLQKNAIALGLYRNREGKFLICKTAFFNQYTLPCIIVNEKQSVTYFLNPVLEKEFNLVPMISNYMETTRGVYYKDKALTLGNIICIKYEDYDTSFVNKDTNILDSLEYKEKQYVTYEEAVKLYKANKLSSYSMYCIERDFNSKEA